MPLLRLTVLLDRRKQFKIFEAALVGVYPFGQTHIPSLDYDSRVEIIIYIDVTHIHWLSCFERKWFSIIPRQGRAGILA